MVQFRVLPQHNDVGFMNNRQRILATIIYADIFEYPLTLREVMYWLPFVTREKTKVQTVVRELVNAQILTMKQGYLYLYDRQKLPRLRAEREISSGEKMVVATRAAKILSRIPTVECIGVTGGVSMNNANSADDIDICIIASDHTVWMTRLLATLIFDIKHIRRKPKDNEVKDKICLNMFWSKNSNPVSVYDWYTAHEILQMRVLFDRRDALRTFFSLNEWVKPLFPRAWQERMNEVRKSFNNTTVMDRIYILFFRIFEPIVYIFQLVIMHSKRTTEVITRECIRFHPKDSRPKVSQIFQKRLRAHHVPLDKYFFHP